jgi:hypothetical protein
MAGTVRRDEVRGTWYFVVDLPPGPGGLRRQKKQRGFPTKKAAQTALADLTSRMARGTWAEPGRKRLGEYLDQWVAGLAVSRENSTVENYAKVLRTWVIPGSAGYVCQRSNLAISAGCMPSS